MVVGLGTLTSLDIRSYLGVDYRILSLDPWPMTYFLSFTIWILTIPLGIYYVGFIVACYWAWFVIPVFGGPQLSIHYAYGLSLFFNFLLLGTARANFKEIFKDVDSELSRGWLIFGSYYLMYTLALGFAWVWHKLGWFL